MPTSLRVPGLLRSPAAAARGRPGHRPVRPWWLCCIDRCTGRFAAGRRGSDGTCGHQFVEQARVGRCPIRGHLARSWPCSRARAAITRAVPTGWGCVDRPATAPRSGRKAPSAATSAPPPGSPSVEAETGETTPQRGAREGRRRISPACPLPRTVDASASRVDRPSCSDGLQHATAERRRSHLADLQIATDISGRTQSENNHAKDDDRCQDYREVTKYAHASPSVSAVRHPTASRRLSSAG